MRVVYDLPAGTVVVEPITRQNFSDTLAANNLSIITEAYAHEFESEGAPGRGELPKGAVHHHFNPDDPESIQANRRRIISSAQQGSQYWRAMIESEQVGLGKLTPSYPNGRRGKAHGERPNVYINDIIVSPDSQRKRVGSALLHGMLLASPMYDRSAKVVFDLFRNPALETRMTELGFRLVGGITLASLRIDNVSLQQWRYQTDKTHNVGTTVAGLERHVPELADHRIA